jgi:hypothetical protein
MFFYIIEFHSISIRNANREGKQKLVLITKESDVNGRCYLLGIFNT